MKQKFYIIKIEMMEIEPLIWRRIVVPAELSLDRLHDVIQIAMGWKDSHLHEFNFGSHRYVENINEEFDDEDTLLEGSTRINKHFKKKGDNCLYVYDFGESWAHRLTLENANYQLREDDCEISCLEGERACPPEDVGGPPGYEEFCKILRNPKSRQHASMVAWSTGVQPTAGKFDPEYFDGDAVNEMLGCFVRWSRPRKLL
ncbi:MAG TPA: plasmid pRiA4b ORF-3 family protein [Candidatus Rifleibacterium sp.]|nr:plasmid pRiA4b ORF-3 family protein [Candidatus Rifleibacterium sp.]HPT44897.1 plasmid pRiA4b ORF-3 family protein [Candidatus Rifleibacterium sp.]